MMTAALRHGRQPNYSTFFLNRECNSAPAYLVPFTCHCNSATGVPRKFLTAHCACNSGAQLSNCLMTISDRNSPSITREEGKERRRKRSDLGRERPWLCMCTTAAAARRRSCPRARGAAERSQPASPTHGVPRAVFFVCNSAACVPPEFLTTVQLSARGTLYLKNFPVS